MRTMSLGEVLSLFSCSGMSWNEFSEVFFRPVTEPRDCPPLEAMMRARSGEAAKSIVNHAKVPFNVGQYEPGVTRVKELLAGKSYRKCLRLAGEMIGTLKAADIDEKDNANKKQRTLLLSTLCLVSSDALRAEGGRLESLMMASVAQGLAVAARSDALARQCRARIIRELEGLSEESLASQLQRVAWSDDALEH